MVRGAADLGLDNQASAHFSVPSPQRDQEVDAIIPPSSNDRPINEELGLMKLRPSLSDLPWQQADRWTGLGQAIHLSKGQGDRAWPGGLEPRILRLTSPTFNNVPV